MLRVKQMSVAQDELSMVITRYTLLPNEELIWKKKKEEEKMQ